MLSSLWHNKIFSPQVAFGPLYRDKLNVTRQVIQKILIRYFPAEEYRINETYFKRSSEKIQEGKNNNELPSPELMVIT